MSTVSNKRAGRHRAGRWQQALLIAGLSVPGAAFAQASCSFVSANSATLVDFGGYAPGGPARDADGAIEFTCMPDAPLGLAVAYTLSVGPGTSANFAERTLRSDFADTLGYNLFVDPARLLIFGDGSAATNTVTGVCAGACSVTVYGRIAGGQLVPSGRYADSVEVTVDF